VLGSPFSISNYIGCIQLFIEGPNSTTVSSKRSLILKRRSALPDDHRQLSRRSACRDDRLPVQLFNLGLEPGIRNHWDITYAKLDRFPEPEGPPNPYELTQKPKMRLRPAPPPLDLAPLCSIVKTELVVFGLRSYDSTDVKPVPAGDTSGISLPLLWLLWCANPHYLSQ
jgi:hypothetical protein